MKTIAVTLLCCFLLVSCAYLGDMGDELGEFISGVNQIGEAGPEIEVLQEPPEDYPDAEPISTVDLDSIQIEEELEPPAEEVIEPESALSDEPIDEFKEEPEAVLPVDVPPQSNVARLGDSTELPMWFVYTSAGVILSILFTLCYISKQRKEAYWRRMRD